MTSDPDKWQERFERERKARLEAENLLEIKKREIYLANEELKKQLRREESLAQAAEEKFATLFNSSMDGIILLNSRGQIIQVNHAIERMLELPPQSLIDSNIIRIIPKDERKHSSAAVRQVYDTGYCRFEINLIRHDRSRCPVEVVASTTKIGDDHIVQGLVRDITAQKIAFLKLKEARVLAEKGNKAKSEFLATMSHEIRTPLNGIIGFTDLVLGSELSSEQKQNLTMVQRSGDILLQIINNILDFSRIESGKLQLEEADFELRECIEEVLELHSQSASLKNLELLYEIDSDLPSSIRGDITRIRQVIMNLTSNALKFTPEGSITISASLRQEMVWIRVKDTGVGFKPGVASTLFEPFTQEDASTTRKYGGTGLGLAICRRLIESMGGSIQAKSKLGEGADFTFSFPLKEGDTIVPEKDLTQVFAGKHALLVDDYDENLIFLTKRLEQWGFQVTTAATGREGVTLAEATPFDVFLIDLRMPEMDGIECIALIRKFSEAPALLLTSSRISEDRRNALNAGFSQVLCKPLRQRELMRCLLKTVLNEVPTLTTLVRERSVTPAAAPPRERPLILVAEDNPINARLAFLMIESIQCRCQVTNNGAETIEALMGNSTFDLILMDMQMPVLDGLETTRRIREGQAGESNREIPILAVTANAQESDKVACLAAGMTDYLSKPLRPSEVKKKLQALLPKAH